MRMIALNPTRIAQILCVAASLVPSVAARSDETLTIDVTLKDHRFTPAEIHVATGKPVILKLLNLDDTADEFDSSALKIEKIVPAGAAVIVRLRPLGPGRFPFMGEFHPDTAKGVVISE